MKKIYLIRKLLLIILFSYGTIDVFGLETVNFHTRNNLKTSLVFTSNHSTCFSNLMNENTPNPSLFYHSKNNMHTSKPESLPSKKRSTEKHVVISPINKKKNIHRTASTNIEACINNRLPNVTIPTTGATGIGTPVNLPPGITANWGSNQITITGIPTASGSYPFSIPLTGVTGAKTGTITVSENSIGGTIYGTSTVCTGINGTNLSLSGHFGDIIRWESSTDGFANTTTIASTSTQHNANDLTVTTEYRVIIKNGGCNEVSSSIVKVTVDQAPIGGYISSDTEVCPPQNTTTLTLSAYQGSIEKWQYSTNGFVSVTDISNTSPTLIITNLTSTTEYRAVVKSGTCGDTNSATAKITVSPFTIGGSIVPVNNVCRGTNSRTLILYNYTGEVLRWESSTNGFINVNTINVTTTTHTASNLLETTEYRAIVKSGACSVQISDSVKITVNQPSTGGNLTQNASVCAASNSTNLTLSAFTGNILRWESSTNGFSTVTSIPSTSNSITATNLSVTTEYRVIVESGACSNTTSNTVKIIVSPISVGGLLTKDTNVCTGTNSTELNLTGHLGTILRWEFSTDGFSNITNIANTTSKLMADNLTLDTEYRVVVKSGICNETVSNSIKITTDPLSIGGQLSNDANVCTGTNSTALNVTGFLGTILRWESSTDGFSTVVNIANTTNKLTAINLTETTDYRVVIKSGTCNETRSNSVKIKVIAIPTPIITTNSITHPTCDIAKGSFIISNYNASYTYTFTPASGITQSGANITATPGIYTITATITGICTSDTSTEISINAQPETPTAPTVVTDTITHPTCNTATGSFNIANYNAAYTYTFTPTIISNTNGLVVVNAGTYTIKATLGACTSDASAEVIINAQHETPTTPSVDMDAIIAATCTKATGSFTITNYNTNYSYAFTPNIISNTNGLVVADPGTYTITVTKDVCTSEASEMITINKDTSPETTVTKKKSFCINDLGENEDGHFDLSNLISNYDGSGTWEDTDNSGGLNKNLYTPKDVTLGDYIVTYTLPGDCGKVYQIPINVNDDCGVLGCTAGNIYTSKVLTPNGDGHNDYFVIDGYSEDCGFRIRVKIFNRWGKRIYTSDNYKNNWNGHHDNSGMTIGSNSLLPSGTYYYIIDVINGDMKAITGYIYLGTN
ncbi:MAG: hypothetical protein COB98_08045 [Flavobacteriaceae bacterium]|nr:MAG: hypothetical protein COB98_08045 [Flavobacteriaceae bacterium]